MTRELPLRRIGAVCLGAVLIGFGAIRYDLFEPEREPHSPPRPRPDLPQEPRKLVLPEPKFGWPVGGAPGQEEAQSDRPRAVREALGGALREARSRADLLSSASDHALLPSASLAANDAVPREDIGPQPPGEPVADPVAQTASAEAELVQGGAPADAVPADPVTIAAGMPDEPLPVPQFEPQDPIPAATALATPPSAEPAVGELVGAKSVVAELVPSEPAPQLAAAVESLPAPPETASIAIAPVEAAPIAAAPDDRAPARSSRIEAVPRPSEPAPSRSTEAAPQTALPIPSVREAEPAPQEPVRLALAEPTMQTQAPTVPNAPSSALGAPPSATAMQPAPPIERGPANENGSESAGDVPGGTLATLVPDREIGGQRLALASAIRPPAPANDIGAPSLPAAPAAALGIADPRSSLNFTSGPPVLSSEDELILDVRVKGFDAVDTIFAYGTREGVYLPFGVLARILDLAMTVSDDGHYASGWTLDESRTLSINLRDHSASLRGEPVLLRPGTAVAFEGELYLRVEQIQQFLPLRISIDLRRQAIEIETLEPFPFEERLRREGDRARLAARQDRGEALRWPREETPWRLLSVPLADLEVRAVADRTRGERVEGDVRLAGDLAFLSAEALLRGDTSDGLTSSLIEFGRTDPDAQLFGPLQATDFAIGDISTRTQQIGLRGVAGRGLTLTNQPPEAVSVFENIDLRGILPDGYEVELYRNDILVGSTAQSVNGQYEFLQVPVDFGLNVLRLVFYGPQGQRSEQVRRITVGDGRLAPGKLVYRIGAVQKDENLLGVRDPLYVPPDDLGAWRVTGELAYGLTSGLTAIVNGAWFETPEMDRWLVTSGIRTGLGRFAIRSDVSFGDGGTFAAGAGIGGRFGNSTFALDHVEYSGEFIDETKTIGREFLRRSTELDFNTTLALGNPVSGLSIPLTARLRHIETQAGRKQTNAALRASTRIAGLLASNTFEYTRDSLPLLGARSQLFGNFDLATLGRSKLRTRASLGYQILPEPDLVSSSIEADYAIDDRTSVRGRVGYAFQGDSAIVGLSAVREFERFTLSFDGNYGFSDRNYSVGLRFAASFGRDPHRGGLFMARPGIAPMGGASMRAFQDMDGDGAFGPSDRVLPDVDFIAFNQTAKTGADGVALLGGLGSGQRVSLQLDPTSLPDIGLAPATGGIEIVPRPGRIHRSDFAVVALSEIEGTASYDAAGGSGGDGAGRGVSGVRLQLRDSSGAVSAFARTEVDGYFFFEEIRPGHYDIVLDQDQAQRLNLCLGGSYAVDVGYESDLYSQQIRIIPCE